MLYVHIIYLCKYNNDYVGMGLSRAHESSLCLGPSNVDPQLRKSDFGIRRSQ